MKKKNRGFTLIELLAVIIIMALLIVISSKSILSSLEKAKKDTQQEVRESLKDIAITYVLENNYYLTTCSVEFSKELYEENNASHLANHASCLKSITVKQLKEEGVFEDNKGYCKENDTIIVYRYSDNYGNSEYKAYASDTICSN